MARARHAVAARAGAAGRCPAPRRHRHHLRGGPAGPRQRAGSRRRATAKQHLQVLARSPRRRTAPACSPSASAPRRPRAARPAARRAGPTRGRPHRQLKAAERVVEWAQAERDARVRRGLGAVDVPAAAGERHRRRRAARLAAAPLRRRHSSPGRFRGGPAPMHHDLFGTAVDTGVRGLNPGLAVGKLRVAPPATAPTRATRSWPCRRRPPTSSRPPASSPRARATCCRTCSSWPARSASRTSSSARRLRADQAARRQAGVLPRHAARSRHPEGGRRAHARRSAPSTRSTRATRSGRPTAASTGGGERCTSIATSSTSRKAPRDLAQVRRTDSGSFCGPKAAFLGELKHLFPDRVARGVVVPFGAYYDHYQHATVAVPEKARRSASPPPASRCRRSSSGPTRPSSAS